MVSTSEHDFKKYAMARHAEKILVDAIGDLHCANMLGKEAGMEISSSIFDNLEKQKEHITEKMTEYGTKVGAI